MMRTTLRRPWRDGPATRGEHRLLAFLMAVSMLAACAGPAPSGGPSAGSSGAAGALLPLPDGPDRLALEPLASGLAQPIGIVAAGDGSGRLYVQEQAGRIRVIAGGSLQPGAFLDIRDRVQGGGEQGLLGLAFDPRFAANGRFYVDYTRRPDGATVISRFTATGATVDPASEQVLLTVAQPYANHNGGQLAFGRDGFLYIGLGDGGSEGDPARNGQNTRVLLGKILRIDVSGPVAPGKSYGIPLDNPFAAGGIRPGQGLPEIWAYGLRNPWRFSFDRRLGDLYIGDVGWNRYEEIDRQPADSSGGENYGWNVMEGRHCSAATCDQRPYVMPIAEYDHSKGCAVTGGYVYRGTRQPSLVGVYIFGDYCSGELFTLQVDEGTSTPKPVLASGARISSFGQGEDGEIYLADMAGGRIFRVVVG
jgi:glucose/arabinose dehydrogenase